MFGTKMHLITFIILLFQGITISTQLLFVIARPKDKTRSRFLVLIISYILYNLNSSLFPDEIFVMPVLLQHILIYVTAILLAAYFVYYIYHEFNISPFKLFGVKSILYTFSIAFVILFLLPYYFMGNLELSRNLFLPVPLLISLAFFIMATKELIKIYKKSSQNDVKLFRYQIIAGNLGLFTLSLLPIMVALEVPQIIKLPIVNFGFLVMMAVYIVKFIVEMQQEALLLAQIQLRESSPEIQMTEKKIDEILKNLTLFEENKAYLKGKITVGALAKRFGTNTRYLSMVVNTHKGKTFTHYINDLRIIYAKQRWKEDIPFRDHFTLKAMAHEIGFTSSEAFTKAFYKLEKVKLSNYLEQLRDKQ